MAQEELAPSSSGRRRSPPDHHHRMSSAGDGNFDGGCGEAETLPLLPVAAAENNRKTELILCPPASTAATALPTSSKRRLITQTSIQIEDTEQEGGESFPPLHTCGLEQVGEEILIVEEAENNHRPQSSQKPPSPLPRPVSPRGSRVAATVGFYNRMFGVQPETSSSSGMISSDPLCGGNIRQSPPRFSSHLASSSSSTSTSPRTFRASLKDEKNRHHPAAATTSTSFSSEIDSFSAGSLTTVTSTLTTASAVCNSFSGHKNAAEEIKTSRGSFPATRNSAPPTQSRPSSSSSSPLPPPMCSKTPSSSSPSNTKALPQEKLPLLTVRVDDEEGGGGGGNDAAAAGQEHRDSVLMTKPAADIFYEDELFSTTEDDEDDEDSKAGSLSSPSVATSSSTASSKLTTGCSTLLSTSVAAPPPPLSTSERSQPLGALLQPRPNRLRMPLQRALTLPSSCEEVRSPRRHCRPPIGAAIDEEADHDNNNNNNNHDDGIIIQVPSGVSSSPRRNSIDNALMVIPTFTVTINPMTADEITYVPDSPSANDSNRKSLKELDNSSSGGKANNNLPAPDNEDARRSSIGSASSLDLGGRQSSTPPLTTEDEPNSASSPPPPGPGGGLLVPSRNLSIRRVSEISHINELRREMSGMEHLASEYYEISREPDPDAISLDSIHKTIFKRCQNKYMPAQRTTRQNKCFVVITSGFTILGIIYTFWYKNFGPGKDVDSH